MDQHYPLLEPGEYVREVETAIEGRGGFLLAMKLLPKNKSSNVYVLPGRSEVSLGSSSINRMGTNATGEALVRLYRNINWEKRVFISEIEKRGIREEVKGTMHDGFLFNIRYWIG